MTRISLVHLMGAWTFGKDSSRLKGSLQNSISCWLGCQDINWREPLSDPIPRPLLLFQESSSQGLTTISKGHLESEESHLIFWRNYTRYSSFEGIIRDIHLLKALYEIFISEGGHDSRIWVPYQDGVFSVTSFYTSLSHSIAPSSHWVSLWKNKALPRVLAFLLG